MGWRSASRIYAEVTCALIDLIRPRLDSPVGYLLTHFHAYVIQRFPIDTFLEPLTEANALGLLALIALASLLRFGSGIFRLKRALARSRPLAETAPASLIERLDTAQTTRQDIETDQWVTHTVTVLAKLEAVLSQLKDAETGQRGYLLTGESQYLEPYDTAMQMTYQEKRDARALTADNPNQQRRLDSLEPLMAKKFAELKETIDLRRTQEFEPALRVVKTHKGKQVMDDIRDLIGELRDEENQLLQQRLYDSEATAQNMTLIVTMGDLMGVVLVAAAALIINRDLREQRRVETALRESEARFRRLAENATDMIYRTENLCQI